MNQPLKERREVLSILSSMPSKENSDQDTLQPIAQSSSSQSGSWHQRPVVAKVAPGPKDQ